MKDCAVTKELKSHLPCNAAKVANNKRRANVIDRPRRDKSGGAL
jgi:hypothetical protein